MGSDKEDPRLEGFQNGTKNLGSFQFFRDTEACSELTHRIKNWQV